MTRNARRFGLVSAIATASVVWILLINRHTQSQWSERQNLLRKQARKLAKLAVENQRLSTFVAPATNPLLSRDQFMELLRLRGEIGLLRQSASEADDLRLVHRELLAAIKNREMADSRPALAYWPRAQLTPSDYADPVSALQTALWAITRNDNNAVLASVTPGVAHYLGTIFFEGDSEVERISSAIKLVADSLAPASGFRLVEQNSKFKFRNVHPDQTFLEVYFEGEGATRWFDLRKIGDEWKLNSISMLMGDTGEPGPSAWGLDK